jgi:hypothetical protein
MILPSYLLAHNGMTMKLPGGLECKINEGLILILSETGAAAEDFTVRIRDEFTANEMLRYMYSVKIEDAIDNITGQWTRSAFKMNGVFVVGIGAKMQVRGKIKGASRPTMVIADDIYSNKNTLTKEERRKTKGWWNSEVMNSIDDKRGKVLLCGTIVHEDTILVELERNSLWKKKKFSLMDNEAFISMIKNHTSIANDGTFVMKFDEEKNELERIRLQRDYYNSLPTNSLWKARLDNYFMVMKYKESYQNNTLSSMWQEYFHIVIGEDEKRFKKEYFQKADVSVIYEGGQHWLTHGEKVMNCKIEIGVDISGGAESSDDTVIGVVAIAPNNRRYIINMSSGKFAIRDVFWNDDGEHNRYDRVIMDKSLVRHVGFIDEIIRLAIKYKVQTIKLGIAGEEKLFLGELRRVMASNGLYANIIKRQQTVREGNKNERIIAGCLGFYETRMIYHCTNTDKLEYQLEFLGKTKNDDCADALEVMFFGLTPPFAINNEEQKEESRRSDVTHTYRMPFRPITVTNEQWKTL